MTRDKENVLVNKEQEPAEAIPDRKKIPSRSSSLPLVFLALLAITCCLVYANTLKSQFVFDDLHNFIENPYTQINEISAKKLWYAATRSPSDNRWLPNISFALNYYFGGREPAGYHLVNIGIHLAAAFVLYLLALKTLSLPLFSEYSSTRSEIALAAAGLWLLHPLQTNVATYLVQRMTSMAAFFCLLSLLCYVYGRTAKRRRLTWYAAAGVSGFLALVSKENSYMLPLLFIGYEFYFLRSGQKVRLSLKSTGWLVAGGAGLLVAALIMMGPDTFASIMDGYRTRDFTPGERLLTETRVVVFYLSLLLFPSLSRLNLTHDFPVSSTVFSPPATFFAIILLVGLCYLGYRLAKSDRLLSFALCWYFANLVIESTIIPLELVFEHRVYLPSVFLILAVTAGLFRYFSGRIYVARTVVVVVVVLLATLTWQRNVTWKDNMTLWNDVLAKAPDNPRAYNNLAEAYLAKNDFASALIYYQKALANNPPINSLHIILRNLGFALIVHGRYDEAKEHLLRAVRLNPEDPKTHLNLGIVYKKFGEMSRANYHYGKARSIQANLFR